MKCPHCQSVINENQNYQYLGKDSVADWYYNLTTCPSPECGKFILKITYGEKTLYNNPFIINEKSYLAIPLDPYQGYDELANKSFYADYLEAKAIQNISPKASIILSKDCLINLIKLQLYSQSDLFEDVLNDLINSKTLPLFVQAQSEAIISLSQTKDASYSNLLVTFIEVLFNLFYVLPNKMKINKLQ